VNCPLDREGAGDVRGIAIEFGAGIDQQQVARRQSRIVGAVMQHAGVGAAADDGLVGRHRVVAPERVLQFGFDLVLEQARARHAHRARVRLDRDLGRAPHGAQFILALEQAQVVQQVPEFEEFVWWLRALLDLRAHPVDPADQLQVELGVAPEVVVDTRATFDQAGQDLVHVGDGIGIVHAELFHRAVLSGARAVPGFALGSRSRQNNRASPCLRPGTSTSTASGSRKPVRYQKSLSCRYG
jgi:hypothetical protein